MKVGKQRVIVKVEHCYIDQVYQQLGVQAVGQVVLAA